MNNATLPRTVAQVAVEAIINDFPNYDRDTALAVWQHGRDLNVPSLYTEMLRDLLWPV